MNIIMNLKILIGKFNYTITKLLNVIKFRLKVFKVLKLNIFEIIKVFRRKKLYSYIVNNLDNLNLNNSEIKVIVACCFIYKDFNLLDCLNYYDRMSYNFYYLHLINNLIK